MLGKKRVIVLLLLLPSLLAQVGCVALNIPSRRFHDPADHGGLFGHWHTANSPCRRQACCNQPHGATHEGQTAGFCIDGGPLAVDPLDPSLDVDGHPKQPDVPWPRFHPVPTRPVFGAGP